MAFFKGAGDTAQLDYIVRTLQEKLYIKDGVTCNRDVQIPSAEVINYWVKTGSPNTSGTVPGSKHSPSVLGLTRKSLTLSSVENIDGIIPGANIETVSADTVNAYVIDGVIKATNNMNEDYITKLTTAAQAGETTYDAKDVYDSILTLAAEFNTLNKASGLRPTACFVNSAVYAKLLKNNLIYFKDNKPASVFPFEVIEAPELTIPAVLMNQVAMISGVAYSGVEVDKGISHDFPKGVVFEGEMLYVNAATEYGTDFDGKNLVLKFAA